jgi:hypothetical protein
MAKKKYYVDFSGYCVIEAENEDEVERLFWTGLRPPCEAGKDDVYDIDGIEEVHAAGDLPFNIKKISKEIALMTDNLI